MEETKMSYKTNSSEESTDHKWDKSDSKEKDSCIT